MSEPDLTETVRSILEKNKRTRAEADSQSARLASILSTGSWEKLDEFSRELDEQLSGLLDPSGKDPESGGIDSGSESSGDGSGEST